MVIVLSDLPTDLGKKQCRKCTWKLDLMPVYQRRIGKKGKDMNWIV